MPIGKIIASGVKVFAKSKQPQAIDRSQGIYKGIAKGRRKEATAHARNVNSLDAARRKLTAMRKAKVAGDKYNNAVNEVKRLQKLVGDRDTLEANVDKALGKEAKKLKPRSFNPISTGAR